MREIPLSRGLVAIVDDEDYARVAAYRWYAKPATQKHLRFYALRGPVINGKKTHIYLHRFILSLEDGQEVDHKNGDGLDNRRSNLRVCEKSQNNANRRNGRKATSGFRGVYLIKRSRKFLAQITVADKNIKLGRFVLKEDAAKAYDAAALQAFGEFATLNFPTERA